MNKYCSVYECNSWKKKNPEISFHHFPKKGKEGAIVRTIFGKEFVDRQKMWVHKLKIGKKVTPNMLVCSLHFRDCGYFKGCKIPHRRRKLKATAFPSQNLPRAKPSILGKSERKERLIKRNKTMQSSSEVQQPVDCMKVDGDDVNLTRVEHTDSELQAASSLIELLHSQPNYKGPKTFKDFEVQINTPAISTVFDLITSEKALMSFSGIQNFDILNCVINIVTTYYKDNRVHKLSIQNRILLTFTKLKCDLSYAILALLFGISVNLCRTYFLSMLKILARVLKPTIYFPQSTEILRNMPHCFQGFEDTQVILDCTEILTQRPKCLCCRIRFYSHYKSNQTVKFMTGVSPADLITFVSKAYGGRASDKCIFEKSGLINMLSQNAAIMVDKGFLIDDLCASKDIKLYRPPFLRNKSQLNKEEAVYSSRIAAARVHIERTNQRIKLFTILGGKLQWPLVKHVDDIFIVACA